jgi:hypothetical protein
MTPFAQPPGAYGQSPETPYRAPLPAVPFAPLASTTRWIFAAIISVMGLAFVAAIASFTAAMIASDRSPNHQPDDSLMTVGVLAFVVVIFFLYAQIAAGLTWVYKAWSWLPPEQRYTRHWKSWISPSQAALMLLIPYFHYYWMFVANCGLCDAMDRLRVTYPTRNAAPKNLAIIACVCQLIVPFPIGSIFWLVFMSKIDRMTREMSGSIK